MPFASFLNYIFHHNCGELCFWSPLPPSEGDRSPTDTQPLPEAGDGHGWSCLHIGYQT